LSWYSIVIIKVYFNLCFPIITMAPITFQTIEEELALYRKILERAPIFLSVNQLDNPDDPGTNHNVWMNRFGKEFIGYDQKEIEELGLQFFLQTMHPDDLEIITNAINKFNQQSSRIFGGLVRLKPRKSAYFYWCLGSIIVLEMKDGKPWRYLVTAQNIDYIKDTHNQIIALVKENLQLKNAVNINALTKREKQIIRLISEAQTDKDIATILHISIKTAKTHRHNILRKLGLKNCGAIVRFALENGLN
jgi:DNA-binding CsgD family transcriptional regulator